MVLPMRQVWKPAREIQSKSLLSLTMKETKTRSHPSGLLLH